MTYAIKAAEELAGMGISAEVIDLRTMRPLDYRHGHRLGEEDQPLRHRRGRLPVCSIGSEIAARFRSRRSITSMRRSCCHRQGCADALCRQPGKAGAAERCRSHRRGQSRNLHGLREGRTMPINITMPALSPTMEEGNLAKWLVKEGDTCFLRRCHRRDRNRQGDDGSRSRGRRHGRQDLVEEGTKA
jgi:hypothetical protein